VSAPELLNGKARDYEVLAASHRERAALGGRREHLETAIAFTVAAIILREVAAALDAERDAA
jgi:hypothetical protein